MFEHRQARAGDTASHAQNLHAAGWSVFGGIIAGVLAGTQYGIPGFIGGWVAGSALIYLISMVLAGRLGAAVSTVYLSSGSSTPARREYSLGDALVAQGKHAAAIAEYERCAAIYPQDPEPRIRLARLHRDQLNESESAARWFKEALAVPNLELGTEALITRELTEHFVRRLNAPERALPVLARLAQRQAATPAGEWARLELSELKQRMRGAE